MPVPVFRAYLPLSSGIDAIIHWNMLRCDKVLPVLVGHIRLEEAPAYLGEPRLHLLYHTAAGGDLTFSFFADGTVAVAAYSLVLH